MPKLQITQAALERWKAPPAGRLEYSDSLSPLVVRVAPGGSKTFTARVRIRGDGQPIRITLGEWPAMSLPDAREAARAAVVAAKQGLDPRAPRREAAVTVAAIREVYIARRVVQMKRGTAKQVERILLVDFAPIEARSIASLSRAEISRWLDDIADRGAPIAANRALSWAKTMGRWALGRGEIEKNPFEGMALPTKEKRRDRVLSDAEIAQVWRAFDQVPLYGPLFKLLLLTGQRLREVGEMSWPELDFARAQWVLPKERTKGGRAHLIRLAKPALAILEAAPRLSEHGPVWTHNGRAPPTAYTKAKRKVDALAPLGHPWTLHDLRRTMATGLQRLGVPPHLIEIMENRTVPGSRGVYQHFSYETETAAAWDKWAAHIVEITS
jgi:integrase